MSVRWLVFGISVIFANTQPISAQDEATPPANISVMMAGVPKHWGETRDYDAWFASLKAAGVTAFLPFSEYQEIPEALSLGYEADFLPPCTYDSPAFQALRTHDMKLIAAAQLLYPPGNFPPLESDPLLALSQCAGEGMIAAVLSIDEPFYSAQEGVDPYRDVRELYERVKQVMPDLPVMMVHAPIVTEMTDANGQPRPVTQDEVDYYLNEVEHLSEYADTVGFDFYPIPEEITRLTAPYQGITAVDYETAFPSYLQWLHDMTPGRSYMMVLQGFSYEQQLSPELAQQARDAGYTTLPPTEGELRNMACAVWRGGGSVIAWWGQTFLQEKDEAFWNVILKVSQQITSDPTVYCGN